MQFIIALTNADDNITINIHVFRGSHLNFFYCTKIKANPVSPFSRYSYDNNNLTTHCMAYRHTFCYPIRPNLPCKSERKDKDDK